MTDAKQLIDRLNAEHTLTVDEYEYLITAQTNDIAEYAAFLADKRRREIYKNEVYVRGLIEIGNLCKNDCFYCGIRRSNKECDRYRLTKEEILDCCKTGYELGFRTFVLQGGEGVFGLEEILQTVREIRAVFPDCAIRLSLGEYPTEAYA